MHKTYAQIVCIGCRQAGAARKRPGHCGLVGISCAWALAGKLEPRYALTAPVACLWPSACAAPQEFATESKALVRTYTPKPGDIERSWHIIDASDVVLGRLASQTAQLLRGKHKPTFAPHVDCGDFVIIINAEKVALTGQKLEQKKEYRHSGFPGGLRSTSYVELLEKHPERAVEKAVRGMLPKNSLGRQVIQKLKVYAGPDHPHQAQRPVPYEISQVAQ